MLLYITQVIYKAKLLQEGIFFLIHLFARDVLVMKKLETEKSKPTFTMSVLKVEYQVVLVSSISNFFTNKIFLANKWMSLVAVIRLQYDLTQFTGQSLLKLIVTVKKSLIKLVCIK